MEKIVKPISGWTMVALAAVILLVSINFAIMQSQPLLIVGTSIVVALIGLGLKAVQPNVARVLTLFGSYVGTIREFSDGCFALDFDKI